MSSEEGVAEVSRPARRRPFRHARFFLEMLLVRAVIAGIRLLPHRALFPLAAVVGGFLYAVPQLRRVILANLAVAFPEMSVAERHRLARRNTTAMALIPLEFAWFMGRPEAIDRLIEYSEECRVLAERCRTERRALIWATPHLGNWELAGLRFRRGSGMPFAVVVRPLNNPWLDRMLRRARESEGSRIIPDKGAVRGVMKAIREGCNLATLVDQNTRVRDGGIFLEFFGLPAPTSRAPALFARKLNALVAVGGCLRRGRQYVLFGRELPRAAGDYPDDASLVQDILRVTEALIRENPEQYVWMYERWRYRPAEVTPEQTARFPYYAIPAPPRFYDSTAPKS